MQDRPYDETFAAGEIAQRSGLSSLPSSSRMLTNYLADIEQQLDEQRWDSAMRDALELPQIAVALGDPRMRSSGERGSQWCRQWIRTEASQHEFVIDNERLYSTIDARSGRSVNSSAESVPSHALCRLRLRRHARTRPRGFSANRTGNGTPGAAEAIEICTALVEGMRRWYAQSACHDAVAQANLARLAVLR